MTRAPFALALLLGACAASPDPATEPTPVVTDTAAVHPDMASGPRRAVVTTTVQPHNWTLSGSTARVTLQCHSRNAAGPIPRTTFTWTSRDNTILQQVTSTKSSITVVPLKNGSTYYVCAANGDSDSSQVAVNGINPLPPGVAINPGDNFQTKSDANPAGTVFIVKSGTHRMQTVNPKAGNQYYGEAGAVMTGARDISPGQCTWVAGGAYWACGGQTQQNTAYNPNYNCQGDGGGAGGAGLGPHPGCFYPEQLFVDDTLYEHMYTKAQVTAGSQKWWFDYAKDSIYIARNPSGKDIQTSVTQYAFGGGNQNIVVKHLTVTRYANESQKAAVNYAAAAGWVIDTNDVTYNHGTGVSVGANGSARGNTICYNGQMGLKAFGANPQYIDNEICYNNTAKFGPGTYGEAGGTKAVGTNGLIVRGNYSHHNDGPGLWTDINNINCLYENNTVDSNAWRGIFHEISYKCTIRNNTVRGNGFAFPSTYGAFEGAGILISNSPNVEVYGNTVQNNNQGIMGRDEDRGSGNNGVYNISNLSVHDNIIVQTATGTTNGGRAGGIADTDPTWDPYSAGANNHFGPGNTYTVLAGTRWRWLSGGTPTDLTWTNWRATGQDAGSSETGQ